MCSNSPYSASPLSPSDMKKLIVYIIPLTVYYLLFFFVVSYLSSKFQKNCTNIGLKFFCIESKYRNGSHYFHDREEKINMEKCFVAYSQTEKDAATITDPPTSMYMFVSFLFVTFCLFLLMWYFTIYRIKNTVL